MYLTDGMQVAERKQQSGKKKPTLHCIGNGWSYFAPWATMFEPAKSVEAADVVLLTGGADIDPQIYGEKNVRSHYYRERDDFEIKEYEKAVKLGKPIIGICRGAQLVCALTGGKLFQHVDGHNYGHHEMITSDGRKFDMTSVHHQMMRPKGPYELLAWTEPRSKEYISAEGTKKQPDLSVDPEVIWFPAVKCIAIQGHPEYMGIESKTNQYLRDLVQTFILEKC